MPDVATPFGRIVLTDKDDELVLSLARRGRLWPIAVWRPGTGYVPEAPEGVPWSGAVYRELVAAGLIVPWPGDPTTADAQQHWRREAIAALAPYCGSLITRWVRRRRAARIET
jgi:hypothetical protein